MNVAFSCPSCGVPGRVDASYAGRAVRCKQCQHRFVIPPEGESDPGGYALEDRGRAPGEAPAMSETPLESVFAPTRRDEPASKARKRPAKRPSTISPSKSARDEGPGIAWGAWLIRVGLVVAAVLALVALFAPRGVVIAGSTMMILGALMVLVGFGAGAFGAFSEDFLYGFLYLVFPLYSAYYLLTRWDDLGRWFACSTLGFVLFTAGGAMLHSAGIDA